MSVLRKKDANMIYKGYCPICKEETRIDHIAESYLGCCGTIFLNYWTKCIDGGHKILDITKEFTPEDL
jgi:hypothetical protein